MSRTYNELREWINNMTEEERNKPVLIHVSEVNMTVTLVDDYPFLDRQDAVDIGDTEVVMMVNQPYMVI
jgi:hypothetical protein